MNKPDIAKLVAAALEAEFGSYRNAELQHITAVNDGPHDQVPLAPLPSLPEPTEGQLAEAFKVQRYDRWRKLFNQRVTLDEAAEMLLGFSEFMAKNAKLVDAHKSNPRAPSRPVSSYLVKAFTDMRGHVEVALQKKDLFADSDGKYGSGDLVEWAKEKGFVADEVLAAWEAYNQLEAGEAEQETAPATPDAVQPGPHTPRVERHTTKGKRRDTLTPVIETAQKQCNEPKDTAEVWATLQVLAEKKVAPLIGATEQGLQYLKNGTCEIFTRDALRKRLGR